MISDDDLSCPPIVNTSPYRPLFGALYADKSQTVRTSWNNLRAVVQAQNGNAVHVHLTAEGAYRVVITDTDGRIRREIAVGDLREEP